MAGLDKIIDQIMEEARGQAQDIVKEAEEKAQALLEEAKAESEKHCAAILREGEAAAAAYESRMESSRDLKKRTALLQAKQELIASVLDRAYEKLCSLDDAAYFDFLARAAEKYALPRKGRMVLSAKDLSRMPEDFPGRVEKLAEARGGVLLVDKTPGEIENGFIMIYGAIEENCTLRALFDSNRDQLQDAVHSLLFAEGANP